MRNLKKVLTLVLTVAMLLSVMVVGTGAAFSDQDSIKNTEAVDMCVSLNIIAGMEDGSFRPANDVTRAQMCKMICIALNGGTEPVLGTNTTPTFNDVRTDATSSWAESFIESCNSQGIVSGVGSGRFNPSGSVTGTQAARMLLVALGYRADQEGFTGDSWAVNVNTLASAKGLYFGLESIDANAAMSRDDAAQMIWNALNAYEIEYVSQLSTENGTLVSKLVAQDRVVAATNDKITLLADKYEAKYAFGDMLSYEWNLTDKAFDYSIGGRTFQSTTDYSDLFGMNTKVSYTVDNKTQKVKVYGIMAEDSQIIDSGVINDIEYVDNTYITINGTKYRVDGGSTAMVAIAQNAFDYDTDSDGNREQIFVVEDLFMKDPSNPSSYILNTALDDGNTYVTSCDMRAIDYDGNGRVDYIVYAPVYAAQVTSVGTKQITTNLAYDVSADPKPTITTGFYTFENNNIYDGIAKNDYVTITPAWSTAYDENIIAKMDSISGSVTGVRDGKVQIDGTWYNNPTNINFRLGGTYEYSNIGSFVFYADQTGSASLNDILYVSAAAENNLKELQAKVYLYDGTAATVTIGSIYEADGDTDVFSTEDGHEAWDDDAYTDVVGKFYTFVAKDGEYDLTAIGSYDDDENQLGYKLSTMTSISKATSSIAGRAYGKTSDEVDVNASFQDDAVVFISYNGGAKMKVVSGAAAKNYSQAITGTGEMLYEVSGGNNRVVVAYINATAEKLPSAKGESGIYAYVVDKPYQTTVDGTKVYAYQVWNGSDTITIYEEKGATSATKGSVISYTDLGDGMVEDIKANTAITNTYGTGEGATTYTWGMAAINNAEDDIIVIGGKTYLITDTTTVLYVDTDKREGQETGSVQSASNLQDGSLINNISYVVSEPESDSSALKLDLLVVDVNNEYIAADAS